MTEQWRPVVGYEGLYDVSDEGRVRSLRVWGGVDRRMAAEPRLRRCGPTHGYLSVELYKDGVPRKWKVHRLVLAAFVGLRPDGHEAAHLDGNPQNNRASNLRWLTHAENEAHKRVHGTAVFGDRHPMRRDPTLRVRGERNGSAKLTEEDVRTIRGSRETQLALARRFGVTQNTIQRVLYRETWRHVPD